MIAPQCFESLLVADAAGSWPAALAACNMSPAYLDAWLKGNDPSRPRLLVGAPSPGADVEAQMCETEVA
jgi:hypothetical protein